MPSIPVSAVIICANAADTIETCIASLARLDEVVVFLNKSNDNTEALCCSFPNVSVRHGEFVGFGPTKQAAVNVAGNDWVFSIDSDEFADAALIDAIASIPFDREDIAYEVLRKNRFCGKHIARGGWGNDRLLRVFHRSSAQFNNKAVHEKVVSRAGVVTRLLDGVLWHDAVTHVDQFLKKISTYSELAANEARDKPAPHPFVALLRSQWAFFRSFVLQGGFLAGWRGVIIAYGRATGTFYKYAKRYTKSRGYER
jgi:glycosyltransferase involved in cell wall biosynthesis